MAERRRRNKVEGRFMLLSQVFEADCSRWSLQLRIQQWNALTSYRQSAFAKRFGGLIGLSTPLNDEYMALDCVTFNIITAPKSCFLGGGGKFSHPPSTFRTQKGNHNYLKLWSSLTASLYLAIEGSENV